MNDRKKILFLVTQSEFGGAQHFIYTLINNLSGYEIIVGAGPDGDDENGLLNLLTKQGIKIERLKNLRRSINPFFDLLGLWEIRRLIKKEQPDILFLCSTKAGFLGSIAWRLNSKFKIQNSKLIYRIGGWTFNDPWPKWKQKAYICLEKFAAKFKDIIVNNSESDKQQAMKLGIQPREKIVVIHNGIDIESLKFFSREEARKKLQIIDNGNTIVGTIANDYPTKGLKYLKEAIAKIREVKCVIIGKGNLFIPDAYRYLKAFDVFVLPSVKEGFPWVVLEAMAAEVPIIATKVGAVSEIIHPSTGSGQVGILIDPGKPEQIKEAIEKLLKDVNLQKNLVLNARKTVSEKFNLSKMLKQYEDLFSVN